MIEFTKIIVEGFCGINKLDLPLNNTGITVIRGSNGNGKTTIFSALVWCLYGINLKKVSDVLTWKELRPKNYKGVKVSLFFRKEGKVHNIIRCQSYKDEVFGAKGNDRLLYFIDTEPVEEKGKRLIQLLIDKNIGMSYNVFMNSVMFGQGCKRLIQETGPDKKKLFEDIFELNYLSEAKKVAQERYQKLYNEIQSLIKEKESIKESYNLLKVNSSEIKKKRSEFDLSIKNKISSLKSDKKLATIRLNKLSLKLKDIKQKNIKSDIEKVKKEINHQKELYDNATNKSNIKVEDLVDNVINLLKDKQYNKSIEILEEIKSSFNIQRKSHEKLGELQDKKSELYDKLYNLDKLKGELLRIKEEIEHIDKRIENNLNTKPDFESILKSNKVKQEKYTKRISELDTSISQIKDNVEFYKWAYMDPLSNNGIKAFLFESSMDYLNEILESYSEALGFNILFGIDLNSTKKDFITMISMDGIEVKYDELSGGQKQLVNLAMALAMNQMISKSKGINIAFLDEVFESLSSDNIELVINLIKKVYKDRNLFLITHQESLPIPNSKVLTVSKINGLSKYEF